jgi:glycosyltransferase involved in cell wall biosynthesis
VHILYFIDSLVPAGAERSLAALAPQYTARGVRLEVAFLHDRPGIHADLQRAGVQLYSIAGGGGRVGWLRRAERLVRRKRPDLVHTTLFEADLVGRVAGAVTRIPVVSSLVNVAYGDEQLTDPALRTWRVRAALLADATTARFVTRFHAISQHVAHTMGHRLHIPHQRIDVVPRGRDPRELGTRTSARRSRARAALGVESNEPLIVAAARQERQKGLDVLLQALPEVLGSDPKTKVVLAGRDGNQTPLLQSLLQQLDIGGSTRFLGTRSDVPDLLCAADVFVVPSRWEGLGSVILEAMALEAPIVASDLPPIREAIGDETAAWLVPVGKPHELAVAMSEVLGNRDEAGRRTEAAHDRFNEHFTISRVADQMLTVYGRALGGA